MDNYEQLAERIAQSAGIGKEEVDRRVEAKRAKLSGLVSKEGAAQIVAAELGINFDQERLKINQLVEGMKRANFVGKIVDVSPVREFNKNNRQGKVVSMIVADESSNTRIVLWDTNHIELIEKDQVKQGDVLEVSNGSVRNGEVHLSSFSDIKKSKEKLENVVEERAFAEVKLQDARAGQSLRTRAVIVQVFQPRFFEVNRETGRKVSEEEKGNVEIEKRAILNLVLDDGSENMRCVLFGEHINKLGLDDEEIFSLEKFESRKEELLGEEKFFSGNVRTNAMFNNTEVIVEDVKDVDAGELIKELESKAL
jgi:ssDNA-binding replication factor A large subunit